MTVAVTATVCAGIAAAQSVCSNPTATNVVFLRNEGLTEQVGDLTFTCVGTGGPATIQIFLTPAISITSKVLATGTTGFTEALAITTAGSVQGVADPSGYSMSFTGVTIPATVAPTTTTVTITNVRVNATQIPAGNGLPPAIKESVYISGNGVSPNVMAPISVAYVVSGLGSQTVTDVTTATSAFGTPGTGTPGGLAGCTALVPGKPVFFVKFGEKISNAFKQAGSAVINGTSGAWATMNTETGFVPAAWPNTPGATNIATSATRVRILITNVPANVVAYFPTAPATDAAGLGTLTLTGSETGALAPFVPTTPNATNGLPAGAGAPALALVGNSGGTIEAVYEVATQSPASLETYSIPVYFAWIANTVTGTNAAVNVSVSFAPVVTAAPYPIPSFASTTSTTSLFGPVINSCLTTLLFPFVTNESGFDTALVIANTSTDPFGTNGGAGQNGTCSLNFYGLGAPTPSTGVTAPNGTGPGGAYLSGQTYAFALSDVAIGFQGYLIAVCNFQFAHGFASLTTNPGLPSATAMGYIALVIPRGPGGAIESSGR